MDTILMLGLCFSAFGASMYAMAYEHQQRNEQAMPVFKRSGKDGFGKYNNYK